MINDSRHGFLKLIIYADICRFAENRRNQRKSTGLRRRYSPKLGDVHIGQDFLAMSSWVRPGFSRMPFSRTGWFEKGPPMVRDSVFFTFFTYLALTVRIPFFIRTAHRRRYNIYNCDFVKICLVKNFVVFLIFTRVWFHELISNYFNDSFL